MSSSCAPRSSCRRSTTSSAGRSGHASSTPASSRSCVKAPPSSTQRQAELNDRAAELDRREAALAIAEERVAERSRELGAVELRRAAVERREEAARARALELERQAGRAHLARQPPRRDRLGRGPAASDAPPETSHVALTAGVATGSLEREGPAARAGRRRGARGRHVPLRPPDDLPPPCRHAGAARRRAATRARVRAERVRSRPDTISRARRRSAASPKKRATTPPAASAGPYGIIDRRPLPPRRPRIAIAMTAPRSEPTTSAMSTSHPSHAPRNAASLTSPIPSPAG